MKKVWGALGVWACMAGVLFLLPVQARLIVWRPRIGTTFSEFGVVSVYVVMVCAAVVFVASMGRAYGWRIGGEMALALFSIGAIAVGWPSPPMSFLLQGTLALIIAEFAYFSARALPLAAWAVWACGLVPSVLLGAWQMLTGYSGASTLLGIAYRNAQQLGDTVLTIQGVRVLRMYGFFPHPNIFGIALALVVAVGWCFFLPRLGIFLRTALIKKISAWYGVSVMFIALCISRSAALAMTCAFVAAVAIERKNRALLAGACMIPVLVWGAQFVSPQLLAIRGNTINEIRSNEERVAQIHEWYAIMRHDTTWLWGTGLYEYPSAIAKVRKATQPAWAYQPVHNVFLLVIAEGGVVGCGVLGIGGVGGVLFYKRWRKKHPDQKNPMRIWIKNSTPLFITLWSLAWFDHALWTSWTGMAYTAAAVGFVLSTLDNRVPNLQESPMEHS